MVWALWIALHPIGSNLRHIICCVLLKFKAIFRWKKDLPHVLPWPQSAPHALRSVSPFSHKTNSLASSHSLRCRLHHSSFSHWGHYFSTLPLHHLQSTDVATNSEKVWYKYHLNWMILELYHNKIKRMGMDHHFFSPLIRNFSNLTSEFVRSHVNL